MVLRMLPTFAMAEESAAAPVHEALVAANVTADGSLTESDWLTDDELSGARLLTSWGTTPRVSLLPAPTKRWSLLISFWTATCPKPHG